YRGDLLETAVVVDRMLRGEIETTRVPRNPLDVLAQQIVAMTAMDAWSVAEISELVHRAYPFSDLGPRAFESTLDMLSGRYPSDEFAELRPRIVWDRLEGKIRGRAGAQRLAVGSGGTIPDRAPRLLQPFAGALSVRWPRRPQPVGLPLGSGSGHWNRADRPHHCDRAIPRSAR